MIGGKKASPFSHYKEDFLKTIILVFKGHKQDATNNKMFPNETQTSLRKDAEFFQMNKILNIQKKVQDSETPKYIVRLGDILKSILYDIL